VLPPNYWLTFLILGSKFWWDLFVSWHIKQDSISETSRTTIGPEFQQKKVITKYLIVWMISRHTSSYRTWSAASNVTACNGVRSCTLVVKTLLLHVTVASCKCEWMEMNPQIYVLTNHV